MDDCDDVSYPMCVGTNVFSFMWMVIQRVQMQQNTGKSSIHCGPSTDWVATGT